ncbi:multi-sensor signal transduction multi-kinase [Nostoc carneum NIES-2107]|nr:multi-sensor signal transduction multi-kinase [Nostoc carneum NIES-2107]
MIAGLDLECRILGYRVVEQLHFSSRTIVYRGIRVSNQQPVIIKYLKSDYPSFHELLQFRNQYTIAKNLDFQGVVRHYTLEAYRNSYILVMEDFGGIPLQDYTKQEPLELSEFLAIALQIVEILHNLHQHRVIHKDLKPDNILINPQTQEVKLIDFSIASLLPRETQEIKNPNVLEGTLNYISPEQTGRMNRGIDYRSDFYSLGITLFELLTGKLPFQSDDPMELIHCHIAKIPAVLGNGERGTGNREREGRPQVLYDIVSKLMAKNPEDRYQSALGLKFDLQNCLEQLQTTGKIVDFTIGNRDVCDRFLIPEKLYGREAEIQQLLDAFERVAHKTNARSELMLVAGLSGIGKTAIVNEVHKPIVRQRGYFIKGKFDQFQRNIPFSGFVQALRNLMAQLLTETDSQLEQWQTKILAALGDNAQIIIEVIPELERIIGKQTSPIELAFDAAQVRFNLLFQKFIRVFTTPNHPLVIFLDDLQWADSASLRLMRLLIGEAETGYLLLIGAYRNNEVSTAHPLMLVLDEIHNSPAIVNTITLSPLQLCDLNHLLADTLSCPDGIAKPLAELVYQKTKGNPFFVKQFLKALYVDKLINFNINTGCWQGNIAEIRESALTDDVVEFMAQQIQKLPTATQTVLKLAACIGNDFDLSTLAIVYEKSESETAADLWQALQAGLILPTNEVYKFFQNCDCQNASCPLPISGNPLAHYKFLHDRVQQAAYSLIPEPQKQLTHFHIGKLLLHKTTVAEQEEKLFEIVNQFNIGKNWIGEDIHYTQLAQLNLKAGKKARTATAHTVALEYFTTGINLLPKNQWQTQYELTLALYTAATEAAYLSSDLEQMTNLADVILASANSLLDKIKAYEIQIQVLQAQNQPLAAVKIALKILQLLGINFPEQPSELDITQALHQTKKNLAGRQPLDLVNLPQMTEPEKLAAIKIMAAVSSSTYIAVPQLFPLIILEQVNLSITYGNTPFSPYSYGCYGQLLCGVQGDIDLGYQFGKLALKLLENSHIKEQTARTYGEVCLGTLHWQEPVINSLPLLKAGYQSGLETGDLVWTSICGIIYIMHSWLAGQELNDINRDATAFCTQLTQLQQAALVNQIAIFQQTVVNLLGDNTEVWRFEGDAFHEAQMLPILEQGGDQTALCYFHYQKLFLYYLSEEFPSAVNAAIATENYLGAATGLFIVPSFYTYDSLAHLAIYPQVSSAEQKRIEQRVNSNQAKVQKWANSAPGNHLHKFYLVEAEHQRVLHNKAAAIELYDLAISTAKVNNYPHEEALANELAAKFYLAWGKNNIVQEYLLSAYYGYARWGATAKVKQLEQNYPHFLIPILQPDSISFSSDVTIPLAEMVTHSNDSQNTNYSSNSVSAALDLATVLKSFQMLASEIHLNKLLSTLLQVVLENAGADKCVLLLQKQGKLTIEATIALGQQSAVLQSVPLENSQEVPIGLINTVKRTLTAAVLIDAITHPLLTADPYIFRYQPKSILCTPIMYQGKLLGILYLENKEATAAFTSDRVELLNLLCTQAAISLENAHLYQQAQLYSQQLEQSLDELKASDTRFQNLANNIPGMIYQFHLATDGSTSTPYVSSGCYEIYEVSAEDVMSGKENLYKINHPDDIANVAELITHSAQNLTSFQHEWRIITPSGIVKWIQSVAQPQQQADGSIMWDGIVIDVSDRHLAEEKIRAQEQFLRSIYDGVDHPIFVINVTPEQDVLYASWNPAAARVAGVLPEEVIGKTPEEIHGEVEGAAVRQQFISCINAGTSITIEQSLTFDQELTWWLTTFNPLRDRTGRIHQLIGTAINISARKLAEAQAQQKAQELETALQDLQQTQLQMVQSEKMSALGNLIAGVAHEINNPVGFIVGNLQPARDYINDVLGILDLYQQQFPNPGAVITEEIEAIDLEYIREDLPKLIDSMKLGVDRIRSISISLRNFSRADKDYKIPFHLHEGLNSTILILKHRLKANESRPAIEVITNYGNLPEVECFPGQLNQVFMNILANAIDSLEEFNQQRVQGEFRPHSHQITIKTAYIPQSDSNSTPHVVIRIKDNGTGMTPEVKAKVFDHLFTTKPVGKGTGLGLAIARQIVIERHEGTITVDSVLGEGTEFIIKLPVNAS